MSEFNYDLEQEEAEGVEPITSVDADVMPCLQLKDVPAIVQMEEMLKHLTTDTTPSKQKRLLEKHKYVHITLLHCWRQYLRSIRPCQEPFSMGSGIT